MKKLLFLLFLFPTLAFAAYNVTNTSSIIWQNTTTTANASVVDNSHSHTAANISDLPTYTNESTTITNTTTIGAIKTGEDFNLTVFALKDLVTTAPITGGTDNILPGADSDVTLNITILGDIVATAPVLINGTTAVNNIIPGGDADYTISLNMLGDLATTAPITGAASNIFPGTDGAKATIAIPKATAAADGYLNMTDWSTFNNKGVSNYTQMEIYNGSVGVNNTIIRFIAGSGITIANANSTLGSNFTITASGDGGNVSSDGAIVADNFARWVDANTINDSGISLTTYGTSNYTSDQSLDTTDSPSFVNITATEFFIGNGSQLTGITGTGNPFDQTLNTTDEVNFENVTASFFFGNGSQLTGIAPVAGNPFDQVLNTTSNVTFNLANFTGTGDSTFNTNVTVVGNVTAANLFGNGSALTGITGTGGGPSNWHYTFLPESAVLDDTAPPGITIVESTGTATPRFRVAQFDAATDEILYWTFTVPSDINTTADWTARINWFTANVTNQTNCTWAMQISSTTAGDADTVKEQNADTADTTTVNIGDVDEANRLYSSVATIDNANLDGVAANDTVTLIFYRDADIAGADDNMGSDAEVINVQLMIPRS